MPDTRVGRWKTAAAIAIILGVAGLLAFTPTYVDRHRWVQDHGCTDGPTQGPYGAVHSCRVLKREAHFLSDPQASAYVLLETDKGLVVLRTDYRNIHLGRRLTARAIELAPDDAPSGLTKEETRQHQLDVDARGGILAQEWILNYGDG